MRFGRKKNEEAGSDANVSESPNTSTRTGKKRKPSELLSSVIDETTHGAAVDLLRGNAAFALPNDQGWAALLLASDSIGGLNLKQNKDSAKGSIIELIRADRLQVIATRDMLDHEFFALVPTAETIERMSEYGLLMNAPYHWVIFRLDESGTELSSDHVHGVDASYADAAAVLKGERQLREFIPVVWDWAITTGGNNAAAAEPSFDFELAPEPEMALAGAGAGTASADPFAEATVPATAPATAYPSFEDDLYADPATGVVEEEEALLPFDENQFEQQFAAPSAPASPVEPESGPTWVEYEEPAAEAAEDEDTAYQTYLVENQDRVVDEREVRDTIARRFLSNDLDLVVDTEEFDRVFDTAAPAITIDVDENSTDWLGAQVKQIVQQANAELRMQHKHDLDDLREVFTETMAVHIERTMTAVSTDQPDSQFQRLMASADRDLEAARAAAPQHLAQQRQELRDDFEKAASSRAEQAAAHARTTYEDKNRPKLERDLADVGLTIERRIEEQHAHNQQRILTLRRKEANVRVDAGVNRIFEQLRERQATQRLGQRETLEKWNRQILDYIDSNRKNDVARADALAEQLARENQVETLTALHKDELSRAREAADRREQELQNELIENRRLLREDFETQRSSWESQVGLANQRAEGQSHLAAELRTQMASVETNLRRNYEGTVQGLQSDKAALATELQASDRRQRRSTVTLAILAIVLTVAGLAIGVLVGMNWRDTQIAEATPAALAALGVDLL